jgi:hypothetical protein
MLAMRVIAGIGDPLEAVREVVHHRLDEMIARLHLVAEPALGRTR